MAPETAITEPVRCEKERTISRDDRRFSSVTTSKTLASTPLPAAVSPARPRISEAFPRMTAKWISERSRPADSRRSAVPPAATGSKITGLPSRLACFPASIMASVSSIAPMLHTRASAPVTASAASRMSWAMVGEAPEASRMLAQSFTVTKLVMHCTRGVRSRTRRSAASNFSIIFSFY